MNLKALRVAYEQYFECVDVLTDVQLLSLHYKLSELMEEDILTWDDIRLNDYLVWQPFSTTLPSKVYSYLLSTYDSILNTLGLTEETIIIDKLKTAASLAHAVVVAEYKDTQIKYEYADSVTGEAVYTPIAQELYDDFFDYYVQQLEGSAIV